MAITKDKLGPKDVFSLVAGSMIGSGIFLVSPGILRDVGSPWMLLGVWVLSGCITILAALSYAELASMFPHDGGQLVYLKEGWGKAVAFAYGVSVVFVIQSGVIAAVATAFSLYLTEIPVLMGYDIKPGPMAVKAIAVGMIFLLSMLQSRGLKSGTLIQNIFTFSKVGALIFVIVLGIAAFIKNPEILKINFSDFKFMHHDGKSQSWVFPGTAEMMAYFLSACIGALFSMDAWNNATFLSNRVENPSVNMPKGLIGGVLAVTVLYLFTNLSYFAMIPSGVGESSEYHAPTVAFCPSDRVATASLSVFFGNASALVVALLIVISTFGCNNGIILSGSIFMQTMAKWCWLPEVLSKSNQKGAPLNALLAQALWSSFLVFSGSYKSLLVFSTFSSLVFYLITIGGMLRLKYSQNQIQTGFRCPGYPYVPLAYIILCGFICLSLLWTDTTNCLIGLAFPLAGLIIYVSVIGRKA
ncbi:MAG: amino acid permease [Bacteroidia bacterium]|nr:amino acid permease [Bacteroidia bacterium]